MHHTVDAHLCSREALSDFMTWQTISCPALFRSHRENAVVSPENVRVWVRFQNAVVTPVNIRTVCERNRIKDSYRIETVFCSCVNVAIWLYCYGLSDVSGIQYGLWNLTVGLIWCIFECFEWKAIEEMSWINCFCVESALHLISWKAWLLIFSKSAIMCVYGETLPIFRVFHKK